MPFQQVTWNDNELISAAKLNTMAANEDWLHENMPLFSITSVDGVQTGGQLFIQAGYHDVFAGDAELAQDDRIITAKVPFPTPFRYRPIVASSYVSSDINYREVAVMVNGLDGEGQPSKNGITVHLTHNKGSFGFDAVQGKYFIHYVAVGIKAA